MRFTLALTDEARILSFLFKRKVGRKLGIVQIEQDFAICESKFPSLICRPIAAQFMKEDVIALFEFEASSKGIAIAAERHYRLVPADELTEEELKSYQLRTS